MVNILYIGNKLSHYGLTKGVIETLGPQLAGEGFNVGYSGTKQNPLSRFLEMLYSIYSQRKDHDCVLIDTYSTTAFWYAYFSAILCRILDLRYIHILHGGNLPHRLKKSKKFCDQIFKYAYMNIAVSGYLKKSFDDSNYPCIVIPNNIDINEYKFIARGSVKPKLLWVRSFHTQYNPKMAADLLLMLLKDFPDAELCMVGPDKDGSMQEFHNYCMKLGITDHVKITGLLTKSDWHMLSEDYDIFINTTNVDNTPVSVIEAMALGMCVVSTNVGGIPYILDDEHNSCLVNPGDAVAMYNKIKKLLTNSEYAQTLSKNARIKAETFDWSVVKQEWKKLLS